MSLKTKILLLVLVPFILISILLTSVSLYQSSKLGNVNIQSIEDTIYELRRNELKNYTDLALTSVEHLTNTRYGGSLSDAERQRASAEIIRNLEYGEDGYFFIYDYEGVNVVHPKLSHLEGRNLIHLKDPNGTELIKALIDGAKNEGDYTDYIWDKPSAGREVAKIGYSDGVSHWEWMIGTGLYVDDLEDVISSLNTELKNQLKKTLLLTLGIALISIIVIGLIGLRFTASEGQIADKRLKELSYKSIAGQDDERRKIAHELQSHVANKLVSARKDLKALIQSAASSELLPNLSNLDKKIGGSMVELFKISGALNPKVLEEHGLNVALGSLVKEVSEESGITVAYSGSGEVSMSVPSEVSTAMYRTSQQALKNVVQHADVKQADIKCLFQKDMISLTISDKGKSFDYNAYLKDGDKRLGGLLDMRIRTESLGGTFNVFVSKGNGTILKVRIPV